MPFLLHNYLAATQEVSQIAERHMQRNTSGSRVTNAGNADGSHSLIRSAVNHSSSRQIVRQFIRMPQRDTEEVQVVRTLLTLPDKDEYVFLSPMGDALRRRFERKVEEAA